MPPTGPCSCPLRSDSLRDRVGEHREHRTPIGDVVSELLLPAPFRWEDGHVAADLGEHHVRFTTRAGGRSAAPYASLNLGRWTEDDAELVQDNYETLAGRLGLDCERIAQAHQVHGNEVQRRDEEPVPGEQGRDGAVARRRG